MISNVQVLTTGEVLCYDPEIIPPPKNKHVWCVSKYGIGRKDVFNPEFDIAWYPLPKLPDSVKKNLNANKVFENDNPGRS